MRLFQVWLRKIWPAFSRLQMAVVLLAALLVTIAVGTLFPQTPAVAGKAWWAALRDRYGPLYGPLRALGLFNLFQTPWFWGLAALLLFSTLACFLNRVWPLGRVILRPRTRLPGERFERADLRATLAFASPQSAETALRTALRRRRYRVQVEPTQDTRHLRADRHRLPRLGTLLTHASLMALLAGAGWSGLCGWRESLTVTSEQSTPVGHGCSVSLRCERFTVQSHADGTPRATRADVVLSAANGAELSRGAIRINHPLTFAGISYYLQGYRLSGSASCHVTLTAVHDPGYGWVIAAGFGLLAGVTLTFHFPHRRIWARIGPTGEMALAGSTAWDKERFARQFEALVSELRIANSEWRGAA